MTGSKIDMIAEIINPMVRGWLNYFIAYCKSAVKYTIDYPNRRLVNLVMNKYKHFRRHRARAEMWMKTLAKRESNMFAH